MPQEIGAYEAKTRLPELLREVGTGKRFTITHRGEPVAELVLYAGPKAGGKVAAIKAIKDLMKRDSVTGVDVKALIDEGRS